jgi:hypothetical protein
MTWKIFSITHSIMNLESIQHSIKLFLQKHHLIQKQNKEMIILMFDIF